MILLTGSSGYLGSRIAHALVDREEPFRVLVRNPGKLGLVPAEARCEIVTGDLRDKDAVAQALRGVKQVIHSAALVKMWARDRQDFWRVNVDGLKALLEAADRAERDSFPRSDRGIASPRPSMPASVRSRTSTSSRRDSCPRAVTYGR